MSRFLPRVIALVLFLCATLVVAADPATQPAGKVIEEETLGYRLICPDGLQPAKPKLERQKTFLGSQQENPQDVFIESVAVNLVIEAKNETSTDQQWGAYKASMEKAKITIVDVKDVKVGGLDAKRVVYSHPLKLSGQDLQVKAVLYFFVQGKRIWTIDGRSEERRFDWIESATDQVATSIAWTK